MRLTKTSPYVFNKTIRIPPNLHLYDIGRKPISSSRCRSVWAHGPHVSRISIVIGVLALYGPNRGGKRAWRVDVVLGDDKTIARRLLQL